MTKTTMNPFPGPYHEFAFLSQSMEPNFMEGVTCTLQRCSHVCSLFSLLQQMTYFAPQGDL